VRFIVIHWPTAPDHTAFVNAVVAFIRAKYGVL
jgi:hypothetical protein